jgi:transposase-like protein
MSICPYCKNKYPKSVGHTLGKAAFREYFLCSKCGKKYYDLYRLGNLGKYTMNGELIGGGDEQ